MYLTWLDSNTWLIELSGKRILLDPWLVGSLMFGSAPWLFKADHPVPPAIPADLDLILLSQGLEDHAHPPTLQALDPKIPVLGSANAAKVARSLGFAQVTALAHGETFCLDGSVEITATPGSLVGPTLVENGYVIRGGSASESLYYEPHGFHSPQLAAMDPVTAVITPVMDLSIPLLGSIIRGSQGALQAAQWLQPQFILPTAASGSATYSGLLLKLLKAEGGSEALRAELAEQRLATEVLDPVVGERFEVRQRAAV